MIESNSATHKSMLSFSTKRPILVLLIWGRYRFVCENKKTKHSMVSGVCCLMITGLQSCYWSFSSLFLECFLLAPLVYFTRTWWPHWDSWRVWARVKLLYRPAQKKHKKLPSLSQPPPSPSLKHSAQAGIYDLLERGDRRKCSFQQRIKTLFRWLLYGNQEKYKASFRGPQTRLHKYICSVHIQ